MATKKSFESFKSAKFDVDANQAVGGANTTYGPYYNTNGGRPDPYGQSDTARTTYNAPGYPQPNSGQDDLTWKD